MKQILFFEENLDIFLIEEYFLPMSLFYGH